MSARAATLKDGDNRAAVMAAATLARPLEESDYRTPDGLWRVVCVKGHIMPSNCAHDDGDKDGRLACHLCTFRGSLSNTGELPEMIFDSNKLIVEHISSGATIEWNALDALRCVDASNADPSLQVAASAEWQSARADVPELSKRSKRYDWTFCTHFDGSLKGLRTADTARRIDLDRLRKRDPIAFYGEVPLFEDELADHGAVAYTVRVRCMPTALFALARYYLRVDDVLSRIIDTRVYAETGVGELLREFSVRECAVNQLPPPARGLLHKPDELWPHLPEVLSRHHLLIPDV